MRRPIAADDRCDRPVGSTAGVASASYTNDIGDALLMAYWKDPDFNPPDPNPDELSRVMELPASEAVAGPR
jgi:hypothetical protein